MVEEREIAGTKGGGSGDHGLVGVGHPVDGLVDLLLGKAVRVIGEEKDSRSVLRRKVSSNT